MASRAWLATVGGATATVASGVAINEVEGPLWVQGLWFVAAIGFVGTSVLIARASARSQEAPVEEENPASVRVANTGKAEATGGGDANTGLKGRADALPDRVVVENTGDAEASDGGQANTGIQLG